MVRLLLRNDPGQGNRDSFYAAAGEGRPRGRGRYFFHTTARRNVLAEVSSVSSDPVWRWRSHGRRPSCRIVALRTHGRVKSPSAITFSLVFRACWSWSLNRGRGRNRNQLSSRVPIDHHSRL